MSSYIQQFIQVPQPISGPFNGSIFTRENKNYFRFTTPGLIQGRIPDNLWDQDGKFFEMEIPNAGKWYLLVECKFDKGILTICNFKYSSAEPQKQKPNLDFPPSIFNFLFIMGVGTEINRFFPEKNILLNPKIIYSSFNDTYECGLSNVKNYYIWEVA